MEVREALVRWSFRGLSHGFLALGRLLYRLEIQGAENMPTTGPAIVTCRHNSGLDIFFAAMALRGKERPVGVTGVITVNRARAWLGRYLGMMPLFREQGLSAVSLMKLSRALQQGQVVFIADNEIPWDGRLQTPRSGVAWCALHTGAPVVAAVLNGGYRLAPRWAKRIPLRGKLVLRIGKPFHLSDGARARATEAMLAQANRRFMDELLAISDPGLIDEEYPRCKGVPSLLWQCPMCHRDEALDHQTRWREPARVGCRYCGTAWVVTRFRDDDYHLKVVQGEPATLGQERPLGSWYDLMKTGLRLVAREDPALRLGAGEELYVQSGDAWLEVEPDNPVLRGWQDEAAPRDKPASQSETLLRRCDRGRLFLTSERFVWVGARGRLSFPLTGIHSAHLHTVLFFGFLYGLRRYRFGFKKDSLLKWLTYTALVAQRIEQIHGHRIGTTNY